MLGSNEPAEKDYTTYKFERLQTIRTNTQEKLKKFKAEVDKIEKELAKIEEALTAKTNLQ